MYKTIIVPIDMSHKEKGPAMIKSARHLGGDDGQIVLVNVVADIPTYVAAELPGGLIEKTKQEARKALENMAKTVGTSAVVEVRSGTAHSAILAVAKEKDADAIVIASHKPGFQDYFLGSTASRVVRHASCSVLVLR